MNTNLCKQILIFRFAFAIFFGAFLGACADMKFQKSSESACQGSGENCVTQDGIDSFDYTFQFGAGKVDILFVNDNSASMSWEQKRLANRFTNFIQDLDSKSIDYRIAMTTTDISSAANPPRTVNQNGALQDGRLIDFGSGNYFLTPQTGSLDSRVSWFNLALERKETESCERFIVDWRNQGKSIYSDEYKQKYKDLCPSGDERGILAGLMTARENYHGFFRVEGNAVFIFLSDEDVQSQEYSPYVIGVELPTEDRASNFVSEFTRKYSSKHLTSHAIITATQSCFDEQKNQIPGVIHGSYGLEYHKLASQSGERVSPGMTIDICDSNYTTQLGSIARDIISKAKEHTLKCENAQDLVVSPSNITYSVSGRTLKFGESTPVLADIRVQYKCRSL